MSETLDIPARTAQPTARQTTARLPVLVAEGVNNTIRWQAGERLHHLFERCCDQYGDATALDVNGVLLSFSDLDQRANQMARHFRDAGFESGDRIGLIVDRSIDAYVALLAVLKVGAAYVPLDVKFPIDRLAFIARDAEIKSFVVSAEARSLVRDLELPVIELGDASTAARRFSRTPLAAEAGSPADQLCYIIYTSGSTGRPKGVAVNHSSICNFVTVASEVYGYMPGDRVYQGMTLAFDFSVEELWVPLLAGATLVPSPADRQMVGGELATFLAERRITGLCCVPTLLATIEDDLPDLRLLLVSGEACPADIVMRWHRPGRRMLNAYGPTEATVTATWTEVAPGQPVTIGVPLPTYTIAILATENNELVGGGDTGEIAIGGIGLAEGYINRDDLTDQAFVPDFLDLPNNPSRRLYRTGDLGRIDENGEIEYLGRIDEQVKIRGYRIELAEIENVLLEVEGVSQVVVTTHQTEPGLVELVAYYTCFEVGAKPSRDTILKTLRGRLPGYMVPAFLEELATIPLLASHKADRKALPPPSGLRLVSRSSEFVAPRNDLERVMAACLADTMKVDAVSIDDHFFDDLGAHSLLMAQFLSAVNQRLPDAKVAISDVYLAPTVGLLAASISERPSESEEPVAAEPVHVASDFEHMRCGALQAGFYICHAALWVVLLGWGTAWASGGAGLTEVVMRAGGFAVVGLSLMLALPVAAKWLLIGRWVEERFPIWSLKYFRFWMVRQLVNISPWIAFRGTALFNVYLRLLGAKVGRGAMIMTDRVPLATDLIRIGEFAVLRDGAHLTGYRAEGGFIYVAPIAVGDLATIGERGVVDAGAIIEDEGQLAHASALLAGQRIPAGKRYHGSPARETDTEFRHLPHAETTGMRRALFASARSLSLVVLLTGVFSVAALTLSAGSASVGAVTGGFVGAVVWPALMGALVLFVGGYLLALAVHLVVPRLVRLMLVADKVYPLYGVHHFLAQLLKNFGHSPMFQILFGDSSAILHYLRWVGVHQPDAKQTGSNFGTAISYDSPFEVEIGSGAMISDGLFIINFEAGSGSFRLASAKVGAGSFLGNSIIYPAGGKLGDNVLLGTKVMIPVDGQVRSNVGLLGSPCFEIPRQVANADRFDPVPQTKEGRRRLAEKNAYNLRTALVYLGAQWLLLFGWLLIGGCAAWLYDDWGLAAVAAGVALLPLWTLLHGVAVERLSLLGNRMHPHSCTIHEPYFWWIERHWKLSETFVKYAFAGTPFRPMVLRWVGLNVGRKVFDDGVMIAEKPLVSIGDYCTINAGCSIHAHSLEDGLYKSDRIMIGDGCTINPFGFVHYGVQMGDGTRLSPDAFLMKGTTTSMGTYWQGNPARPV